MSLGRHMLRRPRHTSLSRLLGELEEPMARVRRPGSQAGGARVAQWGVEEVVAWVEAAGFTEFCPVFRECGVDGDLLLLLRDKECQEDLGMKNGLLRKRFLRELGVLRKTADYSCCGGDELASFLGRLGPEFRAYTYNLVTRDMSLDLLTQLSGEDLQDMLREAGLDNSVHRHRLLEALDCLQEELGSDSGLQSDLDIPETVYDVYITYPRGKGEELASLIQLQLEVRGFAVFGDSHLPGCVLERSLNLVRDTRNFVLVLPPGALDSVEEDERLHAEIATALETEANLVPVTDNFQWPDTDSLPQDIRAVGYFNSVRWVHDYQDACIVKIDRFLRGDTFLRVDSPFMSGARSPGFPTNRTPFSPSGRSTPAGLCLPRTPGRRSSEQRQGLNPFMLLPKRYGRSCASLDALDNSSC